LTDSDCVKLKVISELLYKHRYVKDLLSSDNVAVVIEMLCSFSA